MRRAFLRACALGAGVAVVGVAGAQGPGARSVRGIGTAGYVAKFTASNEIGDSALFSTSAGKVGVGTTTPSATLDVVGTGNFGAGTPGNGTAVVNVTQQANPPDGGFNLGLQVNAAGGSGTGESIAIWGISDSPNLGFGVQGTSTGPGGVGVFGDTHVSGIGVMGFASRADVPTIGVRGVVVSPSGRAAEFVNDAGGQILSGVSITGEVFSVAGDGTVTGAAFVIPSTRRAKLAVQPLEDALGKVSRLNGVAYRDIRDEEPAIGLIAEDVAAVVPEIVYLDAEDRVAGLDYARLTPLLIEAIKQQQVQIDELRAQVIALASEAPSRPPVFP